MVKSSIGTPDISVWKQMSVSSNHYNWADFLAATPVKVDAYNFCAGSDYGYIAFFKTEKWIIKSFKKNQDPRNLAFAGLAEIKDLLSPKKGESNE